MNRPLLLLPCFLLGVLASFSPLHAGIAEQVSAANTDLRSGHPLDALARYRTMLSEPAFLKEGSPELWYNRGLAEEKTGDAAAASLSFRRALLLDPGFAPAPWSSESSGCRSRAIGGTGCPRSSSQRG